MQYLDMRDVVSSIFIKCPHLVESVGISFLLFSWKRVIDVGAVKVVSLSNIF
jgi:hypothetical protein